MYLCISTYNSLLDVPFVLVVVNCFKMCIFALARTTRLKQTTWTRCCELLQNVYLCISTYNPSGVYNMKSCVVNCFKMCIFALARTTCISIRHIVYGCELLQNVYLCISTYNDLADWLLIILVVNCFKMCIFALARTTEG